jgi:hypothetical protein
VGDLPPVSLGCSELWLLCDPSGPVPRRLSLHGQRCTVRCDLEAARRCSQRAGSIQPDAIPRRPAGSCDRVGSAHGQPGEHRGVGSGAVCPCRRAGARLRRDLGSGAGSRSAAPTGDAGRDPQAAAPRAFGTRSGRAQRRSESHQSSGCLPRHQRGTWSARDRGRRRGDHWQQSDGGGSSLAGSGTPRPWRGNRGGDSARPVSFPTLIVDGLRDRTRRGNTGTRGLASGYGAPAPDCSRAQRDWEGAISLPPRRASDRSVTGRPSGARTPVGG